MTFRIGFTVQMTFENFFQIVLAESLKHKSNFSGVNVNGKKKHLMRYFQSELPFSNFSWTGLVLLYSRLRIARVLNTDMCLLVWCLFCTCIPSLIVFQQRYRNRLPHYWYFSLARRLYTDGVYRQLFIGLNKSPLFFFVLQTTCTCFQRNETPEVALSF